MKFVPASHNRFARERGFENYDAYNKTRVRYGETGWHTREELLNMFNINRGNYRGSETVTTAELEAALVHFRYADVTNSRYRTEQIFSYTLDHREPEWKTGDIVQSVNGGVYRRVGGIWQVFGSASVVPHDAPARPLRKIGADAPW